MLSVVLIDNRGKEQHKWLNTDHKTLDDFFRHRIGKDKQLAKILFVSLSEDEIDWIVNHRKREIK